MRQLKGAMYGLLFSAVACLAAFIARGQALKKWQNGEIGSETAEAWKSLGDFFLNRWYIIVLISVAAAVLFFHFFKKEKEKNND